MISYSKIHRSPAQIIALLEQKGLVINDKPRAERFLTVIGFERLRIYLLARRDTQSAHKPFAPGTTFENIIELYGLDEELRAIAFKGCSYFEVAFKNSMSEILTGGHGSHPFYKDIFEDSTKSGRGLKLLNDAYFNKMGSDQRADHYYDKYSDPSIPPMWTSKEFFTFGKSSEFFKFLKKDIKRDIAIRLGVRINGADILQSWVTACIDLRNACAHHDRIFNRNFQKQPQNYRRGNLFSRGSNLKISGMLELMDFVCVGFGDNEDFFDKAKAAVLSCNSAIPAESGF